MRGRNVFGSLTEAPRADTPMQQSRKVPRIDDFEMWVVWRTLV